MRTNTFSLPSFRLVAPVFAGALALLAAPAHAWVVPAESGVTLTTVAADSRGNVAVAGTRRTSSSSALYVARYSSGGVLQWRAEEPGGTLTSPATARAIAVDSRGDVYVTGAAPVNGDSAQFIAAKYAGGTGRRQWRVEVTPEINGEATLSGSGGALVVDGSGDAIVGGRVETGETMHAVAARLDGATGSTEWQWTTPGGEVRALALDADGDVALTGPVLAAKLDGDTGSQLWRVEQTGTETSSQGAPVTRTVTVDRSGNVMVGGFLRNTFEDYRMFYMARFDGETGAYQWEFAGSPQTTLDGATRIIADRDGGVYAGGRLQTLPAMLRLKAGNGAFDWASQPWRQDTRPDAAWSVTDLSVDASCLYVSGSDGVQRFIVAAFNRTGKAKWLQDLGRGQALAQSLSSGALYLVGNLEASSGGLQSVVVSIQGSNGKQIKKRSK